MDYKFLISFLIPFILFPLLIYHKKISIKMNLIDYPDKRKRHKNPVSNIGGLFFLFSILFCIILFSSNFNERFILSFLIIVIGFFLIGFIDDKINLKIINKMILQFFIATIAINIDFNLNIENLYSNIFNLDLRIYNGSILFTIFCILALTNAINLLDGKDGLVGSTFLIFLLIINIIYQNEINIFYYPLIITTILFLIYNLKGKIFLGNSGAYLIGGIISFITIQNYNISNYPVEFIYLLFHLYGVDMIRIYFERIICGKTPFTADNNHLHHHIFHYSKNKLINLLIYLLLIYTPIFIYIFYKNLLVLILLSIVIYILSFLFFRVKVPD